MIIKTRMNIFLCLWIIKIMDKRIIISEIELGSGSIV